MRITLNQDGPLGIAIKLEDGTTKVVRLIPGENDVDPTDWAHAKTVPIVAAMLKEKKIEAANESISSLKDLDAAHAIEVVAGTGDRDLLNKWGDDEERPDVLAAIEARLDAITPKKPVKK